MGNRGFKLEYKTEHLIPSSAEHKHRVELILCTLYIVFASPDIVTCRLYGPRIKSWWGHNFLHPSRLALAAHPVLLYSGYQVCFLGVKLPRHGMDHPPPTSAEVKEEYRYTCIPPLGPYVLF